MNLYIEPSASRSAVKSKIAGMPLVSVLMPAYNHEIFVERAVRSVWGQSYKNIELIAIDDGSSDGTLKVLRALRSISPIPMQVYTQGNQGLCRTLNKCFEVSSGCWVALLASDDEYREDFIERMVCEAQSLPLESSVLHCDAIGIDEHGNQGVRLSKIRKIPPLDGDAFYSIVYGKGFIVSSTMFLSRKLMLMVGPYDVNLKAEDFDIHLRLARLARFVYVDEPLFFSRRVKGSLGSKRRVWSDDIFIALAKHRDFLGPEYKEIVINRHKKLAIDYCSDLDFVGSAHHILCVLKSTSGMSSIVTFLKMMAELVFHTPRAIIVAITPAIGMRYARSVKHFVISRIKDYG